MKYTQKQKTGRIPFRKHGRFLLFKQFSHSQRLLLKAVSDLFDGVVDLLVVLSRILCV